MKGKITKNIQFVWWGEKPRFAIWHYPKEWKHPMFMGIVFGLFEIRIWKNPPHTKD